MPQYMFLYRGEAPDMSAMTQEAMEAERQRWEDWMNGAGAAIVVPGAPFGAAASVVDDGSSGSAANATGYTIVEAADLDGAKALTDGHPFLTDGEGKYAIDIFELIPM